MEVLESEVSTEMATQAQETMAIKEISKESTGTFALTENHFESPSAIRELDQEPETASESGAEKINENVAPATTEPEHHQWLSIDNENYEYQSTLRISLLPRKVQIYHGR